MSGRFKSKKNNFTQVSNSILRDNNISLKAKGLFSLIQSYITIPDFILYKDYLIKQCKEGTKAFDSAWKELKDAGYLKQYRIPDAENRGKFVYEYDLLDAPDKSNNGTINLTLNGEISNKSNKNKLSDHTPQKGCYAKSNVCSEDYMLSGGNNNNTDLSNTDLNNIDLNNNYSNDDNIEKLIVVVGGMLSLNEITKLVIKHEGNIEHIIKVFKYATSGDIEIKSLMGYLTAMTVDKFKEPIRFKKNQDNNSLKFDNFTQRDYDYDSLEKQLLGWDTE